MDEESSRGLTLIRVLPLILIASLVLAPIVGAQLGEIAGQLNFAVQVGHNETLQLHLLNEGNSSIGVQVTAQAVQFSSNKTTQANQIAPSIFISPEFATVPAYGTVAVNVTVFMPLSNKPNWASWEDILSAQEETNASNSGGALILQGVAKLVSMSAIPSTTTTTTIPTTVAQSPPVATPSLLSGSALPIAIIVIIIIIAIAYYYSKRAPVGKKAPARKAKKEEMEEEEETESRESITREIDRLRKEKARLQAEVSAAQKRKGGKKKPGATRKKATTKKRSTKKKARAKPKTRTRRRRSR